MKSMPGEDDQERTFKVQGDHITLGQLLKALDVIGSGGEAKIFLSTETVIVNGSPEAQRGKKLYPGDRVSLSNGLSVRLQSAH